MATYPQYFQLGQNLPKTVGGPLPIGTPDYIIKMLEAAGVQPAPAYSQARPVPMPVVRAAEAIRSIESSNNYRALGPTIDDPNSMYYGDRAYGAYQVMGKNIGPWTREVLGKEMTPEEFLADRAAQDKVFQAKFGQSFYKHGNLEDAASTWFTGQPLSRGAGRSDTLGTTGSEYVDRFLKALPSEEGDPMDIRNMAALQPAQPQPAQPQQSRMAGLLSDPALLENLALAFNTLRMTPDENLATVIRGRQERRADTATRNRTIEFLRQRGREDLAAAVESGAIDAKTAAAQVFAKPEMQQNYEFLVAHGVKPEKALQAVRSGTTINMPGAPTIGTIPPGYQAIQDPATGEYQYKPIPGGPVEAGEKTEAERKATAEATALNSIALIDSVLGDPNLGAITGMVQGRLPPMTQVGTDLNVKIEQLQGQAFLQAFESLKGGGAITEREGIAAQNAIARLNRAQSEEAFRDALVELRTIVQRGLGRIVPQQGAGAGAPDFSTMSDEELRAYIAEQDARIQQLRGQ